MILFVTCCHFDLSVDVHCSLGCYQAVAAGEQLVQQLDKLSEAVQSGTYKEDWLQKAQAIEKV